MRFPTRILFVVSLGLLLSASVASAGNNAGTGQWLTRKSSDQAIKLQNPTIYPICAMAIYYYDDGTFEACVKKDMEPRTTAGDDTDETAGDGFAEVIAVPTNQGNAGPINPTLFGISGRMHKNQMHVMDAKEYQLPMDPDVRADVEECVCQELESANASPNLFKKFGIRCSF